MSIEQAIAALTEAVKENTAALRSAQGNTNPAPPAQVANPPQQAAAPVQQAPAQNAVANASPVAAAAPAAAYPSNVAPAAAAPAAITFDQLQQEVTALYQSKNGDTRIADIVQRYGGSLSAVAPEQYNNLITELRSIQW